MTARTTSHRQATSSTGATALTYLVGDALDLCQDLPDQSVDLIATSPPFLALRNYNNQPGQWGAEPDPAAFLDHLLELTTQWRRLLTPHGSIAVELGDTFAGSGGAGGDYNRGGLRQGQTRFHGSAKHANTIDPARRDEIPGWPLAKSLCGVPTLFAWSLAYGRNLLNPSHTVQPWRIRNIIAWTRTNPMPGALADKYRPATTYITIATAGGERWFDLDAVRGPGSPNTNPRLAHTQTGRPMPETGAPPLDFWDDDYDGDTSWLINTRGSSLAHYAMWPAQLAERLILSNCPPQVCTTCGQPSRRLTQTKQVPTRKTEGRKHGGTGTMAENFDRRTESVSTTTGWTDCGHNTWRTGHVLDPFAGTGTTLHAAVHHGRTATGIDLDPTNRDLLEPRRAEVHKALTGRTPAPTDQLTLNLDTAHAN